MAAENAMVEKELTGVEGLDEITFGGLPKGRPTLIAGSAGSGKTMLGMQFLVHGAMQLDQPGVFMAFEEQTEELVANFESLGLDLDDLVAKKKLSLDYVRVERTEFEETGEYDLDGLFIRLNHAIDSIGAKRVVIDTIETLFGGLPNPAILRSELRRLFDWLRKKGVTAIVTGETGHGTITRQGLEEYVSDCVIVLTHRVTDDISTRRLRVVKYRGSAHGTNEYPFLIDKSGISVLPITSLSLEQTALTDKVSTGIPSLDEMFDGGGFYRGTSVLVSGSAGTGKSSVAAQLVAASCARGEKALYISFEESESQLVRNMRSIGIDLEKWAKKKRLRFHTTRATVYGLEMHLVEIYNMVRQFEPNVVVIDPMTSLMTIGSKGEVQSTLTRLIDFLKFRGITAVFTSLISGLEIYDRTEESVSSLMDTWIQLRNVEHDGERNRTMYLLKSRGMSHSNQVREFVLTDHGIRLEDVYVSDGGIYTGSAREARKAADQAQKALLEREIESREQEMKRKAEVAEARIAEIRAQQAAEEDELRRYVDAATADRREAEAQQESAMSARMRPSTSAQGKR